MRSSRGAADPASIVAVVLLVVAVVLFFLTIYRSYFFQLGALCLVASAAVPLGALVVRRKQGESLRGGSWSDGGPSA